MLAPVDDPQLETLLHRLYGAPDVPAFWAAVKRLLNQAMPRQHLSLREKALLRALHPHVEITVRQVAARELGSAIDPSSLSSGSAVGSIEVDALLCQLTPAERGIVDLLGGGLSNKEIACELDKSVRTVKTQLTSVYKKFDVHSRSKLLAILSRKHKKGRTAVAARPARRSSSNLERRGEHARDPGTSQLRSGNGACVRAVADP